MKTPHSPPRLVAVPERITDVPALARARRLSAVVEGASAGKWPKVTSVTAFLDFDGPGPPSFRYTHKGFFELSHYTRSESHFQPDPVLSSGLTFVLAGASGCPDLAAAVEFLRGSKAPARPITPATSAYVASPVLVVVDPRDPLTILGAASASLSIRCLDDRVHAVAHLGAVRVIPSLRARGVATSMAGELGGLLGALVATVRYEEDANPCRLFQTVVCQYRYCEELNGLNLAFEMEYCCAAPNPDFEEIAAECEDGPRWILEPVEVEVNDSLPEQLPPLPHVVRLAYDRYMGDVDFPDDGRGPSPPGNGDPEAQTFRPEHICRIETLSSVLFDVPIVARTCVAKPTAIDPSRAGVYPEAITDALDEAGDLVAQVRWCMLLTTNGDFALDILDESSDTDVAWGRSIFADGGYRYSAVKAWGAELSRATGFVLIEHLYIAPKYRGGALTKLLSWFTQNIPSRDHPVSIVNRTWHDPARQRQTDADADRFTQYFRSERFVELERGRTFGWRPDFFAIPAQYSEASPAPGPTRTPPSTKRPVRLRVVPHPDRPS